VQRRQGFGRMQAGAMWVLRCRARPDAFSRAALPADQFSTCILFRRPGCLSRLSRLLRPGLKKKKLRLWIPAPLVLRRSRSPSSPFDRRARN